MENKKVSISVEAMINAPIEKVWNYWTTPEHIKQWNNASPDWHTPSATNDLRVGGKFVSRMEARDGSFGFDFEGVYDVVEEHREIAYTMSDGRKTKINFDKVGDKTHVTELFDAESENPVDMQRQGWQAILDNFKRYTENN